MSDRDSGVKILTGDQRKGIIALAVPLCIAVLVQQVNNLVDSIWVSGLGAGPMAAIGLVSPLYVAVIGIGNGLGIGVSSAISRAIGKGKKEDADAVASQGVLTSVLISAVLTVFLLVTAEPILNLIGAGDTLQDCLDYAIPLYVSTIFLVMSGVFSGMLRGEGAAKRSTVILSIAAILNMILDPIMIYTMGMGVAGAAWATSVSLAVSSVIPLYWYFLKKDTYVSLRLTHWLNKDVQNDILSVGLPEMLELSIMSLFNVFLNYVVVVVGGTDAVAVYNAAWRVMYLLIAPAQAIGGALISMCSAEFGMGRFDQIRDGYRYALVVSLGAMAVFAVLFAVFADPIASLFTQSDDLAHMHWELQYLMYVMAGFLPAFTLVFTGSSLMQALKRAGQAMVNTLMRNVLITILFAVVAFAAWGMHALWWMLFAGEILGGILMGMHAWFVLKDTSKKWCKLFGKYAAPESRI